MTRRFDGVFGGDPHEMWKRGLRYHISSALDPNSNEIYISGNRLFIAEGSIFSDRLQYGWDDGPFIGPIERYKRDADRLEEKARNRIKYAYAEAELYLRSLRDRL